MKLDEFELLCDKPLLVDDVGYIKKPQLYDIRDIGYDTYEILCNYLSVDFNRYLEITELKEKYDNLSSEGKEINAFFTLLIRSQEFRDIYKLIFSFFISENVIFNEKLERFEFFKVDTYNEIEKKTAPIVECKAHRFLRKLFKLLDIFNLFNHKSDCVDVEKNITKENIIITGIINNNNFEKVRDYILQICHIQTEVKESEQVKYKNETARKWAEKMAEAENEKQEKDNMSIGKMISKYCADNKNGINILNVYSLTMYQFLNQFIQHNYIRQSDIQDMVYANTVSFSDLKSYDSQLWLK